MPRTRIAFVVAPLTGSLLYWWFETVEHLRRTGVMPSQNLGFLGFISIFAFVVTALLALPVYLLLRRYNLLKNSTILFAGTLIGWLLISFSDDGRLWEHPEGFVTGIVAGFTFLLVRGKCVSQDGRS